ncbi:MAG: two-component sensor histidine kinase [Caulobacteraceae bacterium]|nr:two-component sensor histidine kinase [Caulobacteraceae bacterium]
MRMPRWRWTWRWTLSHQILALAAVSIMAAQLAGLVVLLTLPPRPPALVPMDQALERVREALKQVGARPDGDAEREARAASDHRLTFSVRDEPPVALNDPFSRRLAQVVAIRLNLPDESVRIFEPGPQGGAHGLLRGERRGPGGGPDADAGPAADERFAPPAGQPPPIMRRSLDEALGRPPGREPSFRRGDFNFLRGRRALAVKVGERWLIARSPVASADALWLRQVGLTFALTLAALLLPALWLASRTALRIRHFAEGADRFGRNPDAPLLLEEGPHELRQAIGAFNRMQARIQRLVTDRTMMMAAVSHDLRTPLARVRFRIAELEPETREAIAQDIEQMDELIGQLLTFTRDALPNAQRRRFDLSALAQSLVDDLADSGADVRFEGPDKLTVEANLAAVRRILSNLLDNAIKFAGHARVRLELCGDLALAIVEDDGPGVPEAMREAVFEPFRRVEPSRNRETGGVGLGLAIARNLARGHGGDIALDPAAPAGARFIFSLPLR